MYELLPGDPALSLISTDTFNVDARSARRRRGEQFNLDDTVPVRYVKWLGDALTGDLGESFRTRQPVSDAIWERLAGDDPADGDGPDDGARRSPSSSRRCRRSGPVELYDRGMTTVSFALLAVPTFIGGAGAALRVRRALPAAAGDGVHAARRRPGRERQVAAPAGGRPRRSRRRRCTPGCCAPRWSTTLQEDYILMARANGIPTWRDPLRATPCGRRRSR